MLFDDSEQNMGPVNVSNDTTLQYSQMNNHKKLKGWHTWNLQLCWERWQQLI